MPVPGCEAHKPDTTCNARALTTARYLTLDTPPVGVGFARRNIEEYSDSVLKVNFFTRLFSIPEDNFFAHLLGSYIS